MIKIFVTGDVHIGRKYDRYPQIREKLIRSRFECLLRCVRQAEKENCDFLVITGDLFDSTGSIRHQDVIDAVSILSSFGERVIVLPGNHDYYTGEEKLWKDFTAEMEKTDNNITLIREFAPLEFLAGDEKVVFYPAFCQSKHSTENNLGWIKQQSFDPAAYNVGIAHGAIEGLSPDMKNEYFLMTQKELESIPVDAWLIGHTHVPYPADLPAEKETKGYRIFNPGTPQQTDLSNNTEGICHVLTLTKDQGKAEVSAHSFQSGEIRYYDLKVKADNSGLKEAIGKAVENLGDSSIVRLTVSGTVSGEEYADRQLIYDEMLDRLLSYEIVDTDLCELITPEKIRSEFAEIGFAAGLLEALQDPREIQMAYDLIKRHQS